MATALPTAWHKVRAQIDQTQQPTEPEQRLLDSMGQIFDAQCRNAISMTEPLAR
jgi:serine/threonine-protein kinase HipA